MPKKSENTLPKGPDIEELLKQRIKELKTRKMLPNGYGKIVAERVVQNSIEAGRPVKCTENNVNQVVAGNSLRIDIIEALIEVVENSKRKQLLDRLNKLLE